MVRETESPPPQNKKKERKIKTAEICSLSPTTTSKHKHKHIPPAGLPLLNQSEQSRLHRQASTRSILEFIQLRLLVPFAFLVGSMDCTPFKLIVSLLLSEPLD
uniref:Uncharacterized protein n=1 Tax=Opuntia streptacantha TaxID=393608 RepID=A0A7C9EGF7_OPUST